MKSFYKVSLKEGHLGHFSPGKDSKPKESTCPWYKFNTIFPYDEHPHMLKYRMHPST